MSFSSRIFIARITVVGSFDGRKRAPALVFFFSFGPMNLSYFCVQTRRHPRRINTKSEANLSFHAQNVIRTNSGFNQNLNIKYFLIYICSWLRFSCCCVRVCWKIRSIFLLLLLFSGVIQVCEPLSAFVSFLYLTITTCCFPTFSSGAVGITGIHGMFWHHHYLKIRVHRHNEDLIRFGVGESLSSHNNIRGGCAKDESVPDCHTR